MRTAIPFLLLCLVGVAVPAAAHGDLTPEEIVDRALDTDSVGFQTGAASMTLIIQDPSGESRERRLDVRGTYEGGLNRAVVRVTAPAAQAGQSYLFRENAEGEDDVYVFLPALDDAPRRISGSQKNGSFMGTHFTYADLESRDIRDATYTQQPDEMIGGFEVHVIDAVPDNPSDTDYASVRMWIRHDDFIPLRMRFFDETGQTLKTMFTEEIADSNGRLYVRRMSLRPADGGSTTMIIEDIDFDAVVDAAELTPQALAQ